MRNLIMCTIAASALACSAAELKVLMIGNSFSHSVLHYFPRVAASVDGCKLKLAQCGIGGCVLQRHCEEFDKAEADPNYRPYWTNRNEINKGKHSTNVQEMLQADQWDIITIQQGSHQSWRPESFGQYADKLIGIIRKYQPNAEIVIQQTWSYRLDDPRIMPGGEWGIDQTEMYERLTKNYQDLAKKYGLRIIPTGLAVQIYRQKSPLIFKNYDPATLKNYNWPDLPSQAGAVVGNLGWRKDRKTGKLFIERDSIHLNNRGEYMQACVWLMTLFNKKAADITFIPDNIADDDAAFLKQCAEEAVMLSRK